LKVAVLGVGLIGGSIGLAARRRLDSEVAGFDTDPETVDRAIAVGAIDRGAASIPEAVSGAEIAFCAAPVGALPEVVATALDASGPETTVTDVGSTKRELIAGLRDRPEAERFVGGHPLAGAETAGVENARADLFAGARWYLVPTPRSGGVGYDRLQRAVAELGARPQAIDAEAHDRMMATVSHLPHVLANVLVQEASATLAADDERVPEVGPSFRDTARVAGANPGIWADIFATNRDAVATGIEAVAGRLREAAELIRSGDAAAVRDWHLAAGAERRRLLEAELVGGELRELRVAVPNRPGTVAEIAVALGNPGVNIEDMRLYPAPDMRTGAVSIWIAGAAAAERAAEIVRSLGHSVSIVTADED
jgi:prephenate dehydrogenase